MGIKLFERLSNALDNVQDFFEEFAEDILPFNKNEDENDSYKGSSASTTFTSGTTATAGIIVDDVFSSETDKDREKEKMERLEKRKAEYQEEFTPAELDALWTGTNVRNIDNTAYQYPLDEAGVNDVIAGESAITSGINLNAITDNLELIRDELKERVMSGEMTEIEALNIYVSIVKEFRASDSKYNKDTLPSWNEATEPVSESEDVTVN